MVSVLLIHGAATSSWVWRKVTPILRRSGLEVIAPDRPCSGNLDAEIDFLAPLAAGKIVAGVSGGATLGWELVSRSSGPVGALLHEPAAGSLYPGLLCGPRRALSEHGPEAFARTLYGPSWSEGELGERARVADDVSMFADFEPQPPHPNAGPVLLTVGERSPESRHTVTAAYGQRFATSSTVLLDSAHAVHLDHPEVFAHAVIRLAESTVGR